MRDYSELVQKVQDDLNPWADSLNTAFIVEEWDGRLMACATGLPLPTADTHGRPGRARCVVIASVGDCKPVLLELTALIVDGLPDGLLTRGSDGQPPLLVQRREIPGKPSDSRLVIQSGRQRRVRGVKEGAKWLPHLDVTSTGGRKMLALGSPLLSDGGGERDETIGLAHEFALICGPHVPDDELVVRPKGAEGKNRGRPYLTLGLVSLVLLAVLVVVLVVR